MHATEGEHRMKPKTLLLIWFSLATTVCVAAPALKSRKTDDGAQILGVWKEDSISVNGGQPAAGADYTFRFSNDGTCGITTGNNENPAKYFLVVSTTPRRMKWLNGPEMTEWTCLYELNGDTLKIAFSQPGQEPPESIAPSAGVTIYYLKRVRE
jgi:uncharacterized protein (TIGR03067 family)